MSVQTQIDRISGAVSAALAALAEKGVTVPAGTKADGLAALIAAIEAGAGSGGGNLAVGSFVPSEAVIDMQITHDLGVIPNFYIAYSEDVTYQTDYVALVGLVCYAPDVTKITNLSAHWYYNKNTNILNVTRPYSNGKLVTDSPKTTVDRQKVPCVYRATETTCNLYGYYNSGYHRNFVPGVEYKWIVGVA
jgi:hypothetical protein